jgi:hypothetical protein
MGHNTLVAVWTVHLQRWLLRWEACIRCCVYLSMDWSQLGGTQSWMKQMERGPPSLGPPSRPLLVAEL